MAVVMMARMSGMTPETYDALNDHMNFPAEVPDGLLSHVAAPIDGGMQIVDVWESEDKFFHFFENALQPAMQAAGAEGIESTDQHSLPLHLRWSA